MNTITISDIRNEIKNHIDFADDKTIEKIYALLMPGKNKNARREDEFIGELDRRTKEYESGITKLYTLEEMENNARKAYKERNK